MTNLLDFSNNVDRLRLKLDYEKYDQDKNESDYKSNNAYGNGEEELKPIQSNKPAGISIPQLDLSSLVGSNNQPSLNTSSEPIANTDIASKTGSAINSASGSSSSGKRAFGSINGKGAGFADSAGGIAQYGMQMVNMFGTEAKSEKESWGSFGSAIAGGASIGATVGGPWGAVIGAAAGLVMGTVDMIGDTKKRRVSARNNYDKMLEMAANQRKQDYLLEKGEESINKLTQLRKAQLNYINTDF